MTYKFLVVLAYWESFANPLQFAIVVSQLFNFHIKLWYEFVGSAYRVYFSHGLTCFVIHDISKEYAPQRLMIQNNLRMMNLVSLLLLSILLQRSSWSLPCLSYYRNLIYQSSVVSVAIPTLKKLIGFR